MSRLQLPFLAKKNKNLLLLDCHSQALDCYWQPQTSDLAAVNFSDLRLIASVSSANCLSANLLSQGTQWQDVLQSLLRQLTVDDYQLIFLVAAQHLASERQVFATTLAPWQAWQVVDRHFFYHHYLVQKRNFSAEKLLIMLFPDQVELAFFSQEHLLAWTHFPVRRLWTGVADFLQAHNLKKPECAYLFRQHYSAPLALDECARNCQMEMIEIDALC